MSLWTKIDEAAGKPKYLSTADKAKAFFVSEEEAQTPANKAKGINGAGWWLYSTYTDSGSVTRHKAECLVAMTVPNSISGDAEDVVTVDPVITIATQPAAATVADGEGVTFSVVASASNGGTLTYQWQVNEGVAYADIADATSLSYTHNAATAEDGFLYRVVISTAGGANVTSDGALLTISA